MKFAKESALDRLHVPVFCKRNLVYFQGILRDSLEINAREIARQISTGMKFVTPGA